MKNLELSEVLAYSAYALLIIFFVAMSVMAAYEWRRKMPRRWKSPVLIFLSLFNSVSLVAYDIFMYGYVSGHLVSVVSLAVMPMFVSSLSYDTEKAAMYVSLPVTVFAAVLFVMKEKAMFFAGAGGLWIMPVCAIAAAAAISVVSILYPIRDMTGFICSLSVPRFFTVRLNFLYFMTYLFLMSVSSYLWTVHGTGSVIAVCLCLCLMLALAAALFVRMISDRLFIVMREKEEKMMEAARAYTIGVPKDMSVADGAYMVIFARLKNYFEEEKPFLAPELSIADVARSLFTNRAYLSRAISVYTGRNFCQYVNYHRIRYAVRLYSTHPDLKVADLAELSGFRTVNSFNMAFKLYMNDTPGEWCKKNRHVRPVPEKTSGK